RGDDSVGDYFYKEMDRKTRWEPLAVAAPFDVRWSNRRRGALPLACEGGYATAPDLWLPTVDSAGLSCASVTTIESSSWHSYWKHSFGPSSDVSSFGSAISIIASIGAKRAVRCRYKSRPENTLIQTQRPERQPARLQFRQRPQGRSAPFLSLCR